MDLRIASINIVFAKSCFEFEMAKTIWSKVIPKVEKFTSFTTTYRSQKAKLQVRKNLLPQEMPKFVSFVKLREIIHNLFQSLGKLCGSLGPGGAFRLV